MAEFGCHKLLCVSKFRREHKYFSRTDNRRVFWDKFEDGFRKRWVQTFTCTFRIVFASVIRSGLKKGYLMGLLFVDINHLIALGAFLNVSETVSFMKVNLV